jgi:hypothetical protein
MMGSFSLIGGDLSAPGAITGGIAEALIATAFGLGIAITSLLPFNFLNARIEEARHEIESAATQLELMVHPGLAATALPGPLHGAREQAEPTGLAGSTVSRDEAQRHDRKREAIQRQMAALRAELEEHDFEVKMVPYRERASQHEPMSSKPAKE